MKGAKVCPWGGGTGRYKKFSAGGGSPFQCRRGTQKGLSKKGKWALTGRGKREKPWRQKEHFLRTAPAVLTRGRLVSEQEGRYAQGYPTGGSRHLGNGH